MSKELEKAIEETKRILEFPNFHVFLDCEEEALRLVIEAAERDLELSKEYPLTTEEGGKE